MSETLYYLMVAMGVVALLMFFRPFRGFVLGIVGAKSVWGLVWSGLSIVLLAHWTVIRNFLPRSFVLPTLDDRKTTNAED